MWKKETLNDPLNMTSFAWLGSPILGTSIYTHWLKIYKVVYPPQFKKKCVVLKPFIAINTGDTVVIRQLNDSELGNHLKLSIFGSSGRFSSPFRQGQFGEPPASRQVASSGDDILPLDPSVHHDFLDLTYMQYILVPGLLWIISLDSCVRLITWDYPLVN